MSPTRIFIHLENGPGVGKRFLAKRAPRYLRAVKEPSNHWNILELQNDTPKNEEEIFVYKMFDRARGRGGGMHYYYRYVVVDGTLKGALRYRRRWQEWVIQENEKGINHA